MVLAAALGFLVRILVFASAILTMSALAVVFFIIFIFLFLIWQSFNLPSEILQIPKLQKILYWPFTGCCCCLDRYSKKYVFPASLSSIAPLELPTPRHLTIPDYLTATAARFIYSRFARPPDKSYALSPQYWFISEVFFHKLFFFLSLPSFFLSSSSSTLLLVLRSFL